MFEVSHILTLSFEPILVWFRIHVQLKTVAKIQVTDFCATNRYYLFIGLVQIRETTTSQDDSTTGLVFTVSHHLEASNVLTDFRLVMYAWGA